LQISWAAKISAALAFAGAIALLAPIAYGVVSIRCCEIDGGTEIAGWVLIGLLVLLAATVLALLVAALSEFCARAVRRRRRK
jgi:hypothetical protein